MSNFDEPSVLDYVKSRLAFWRKEKVQIPAPEGQAESIIKQEDLVTYADIEPVYAEPEFQETTPTAASNVEVSVQEPQRLAVGNGKFPWFAVAALILALVAQRSFEPPEREALPGVILYLLAGALAVIAFLREEWFLEPPQQDGRQHISLGVRRIPIIIAGVLTLVTFVVFGNLKFSPIKVFLWLAAFWYMAYAFWITPEGTKGVREWWQSFWRARYWRFSVPKWSLWLLVIAIVVIFFRVYQLRVLPGEMVSDHAEKLLDVSDILRGDTKVYFERNTGREFIQFYLTALVIKLFGTGLSFMSLKIGTVLAGLLTLPYIFLLGKEIGGVRVGLLALFLAGIAYWPNVISRFGLRFPFYPLFVAPVMFYVMRGLRRMNRHDFIWAGFFLGLGLHGYSPIRILPFVVVVAFALYLIHRSSGGARQQVLVGLIIVVLISLVLFVPLLRYVFSNPEYFLYRTFTRMGEWERSYDESVVVIFFKNFGRAMAMFGWDDGETWVHSITHRPALDVVGAALFHLGALLLLVRYLRKRHWSDLFLLISIPMLMLPSILALAFPNENPALNRTAGAMVPVFVIIALALDGFLWRLESLRNKITGKALAWGVGIVLVAWSLGQNYDLVFRQYYQNIRTSLWNASEIGRVIRGFGEFMGETDSAWVVAYPYWVDTRLVGIQAGVPLRDFAIWPENFRDTLAEQRTKLFIVYNQDTAGLAALRQLYPQGMLSLYQSQYEEGKNFFIYLVPQLPLEP